MNIKDWAALNNLELPCPVEQLRDGYHSFGELYEHRLLLTAHLFNAWDREALDIGNQGVEVFKSYRHHDGELCFGGGWFIVVAMLPGLGQISYHYENKHWDLFDIQDYPKSPYPFDGHTGNDVIQRLRKSLVRFKNPFEPRLISMISNSQVWH